MALRQSAVSPLSKTTLAPKRPLRARVLAPMALATPATEPTAAPVIKWVGGKSKLVPELVRRMPATFRRYYEPFAGGLAVYFRVVSQTGATRSVINDGNPDLIGLYRVVASDVEALIRRLEVHRGHHAKDADEHYYSVRARWNDKSVSWTDLDRAAAFVYLNKTCFNGLWRVNQRGGFNVPMGRYDAPPICAPDALRAASGALQGAELRCGDFRAAVADAKAGDFLYFDPPYDPVATTANFTGYTKGGFSSDDQRELGELARMLVARGCRVMLSNSDTPLIRSIYKGFSIDSVKCARAINSNAAKRGAVDEVVVSGGY
jgi:DNA adenine methylase